MWWFHNRTLFHNHLVWVFEICSIHSIPQQPVWRLSTTKDLLNWNLKVVSLAHKTWLSLIRQNSHWIPLKEAVKIHKHMILLETASRAHWCLQALFMTWLLKALKICLLCDQTSTILLFNPVQAMFLYKIK